MMENEIPVFTAPDIEPNITTSEFDIPAETSITEITVVSTDGFSYEETLTHIENNTSGLLLMVCGIALIMICTVIGNTFKSFL